MTYIIKFRDEHGDWFYRAPNQWSDSVRDAYRFADKIIASNEAFEAEGRLNKDWHSDPTFGAPGARARCRVVSMRAGS